METPLSNPSRHTRGGDSSKEQISLQELARQRAPKEQQTCDEHFKLAELERARRKLPQQKARRDRSA
jgi:hypothetical protein